MANYDPIIFILVSILKHNKKKVSLVHAAADGYVSRIKISEVGYGKAIYITHPNGYTSVYGHLQSGFGEIEKQIKKLQYKAKSYEIDVQLSPNELNVKQDDIIALSGNTGGSDGPHLHFEIRETQSEKIINPMYFGFDSVIADTKRPIINSLWVYPLDKNSVVNQTVKPIFLSLSLQDDGSYISEKVMASGKIGFGITALDFDDVSWNANGVFRVQSYLNGKSSFAYQFDTFAFDETRNVNALIDYGKYKKQGQRVQKLFMQNEYGLSIIRPGINNGIITVIPNFSQTYRIEISDFNENITKIFVPIQFSNLPSNVKEELIPSKYLVKTQKENIFSLENVTVTFPAHTFIDDFYMNYEVKNGIAKIHEDVIPAFTNFSVTFEDSITPQKEREKMFIGLIDGKKINYYNTKRYKNSFTAYTKIFG